MPVRWVKTGTPGWRATSDIRFRGYRLLENTWLSSTVGPYIICAPSTDGTPGEGQCVGFGKSMKAATVDALRTMESGWWTWVSPNGVEHLVPKCGPCVTCGQHHEKGKDGERDV